MKLRRGDFIIVAGALLLAGAIWIVPALGQPGATAVIEQDGAVFTRVSLLDGIREIKLRGALVRVADGKISVTQSDCSDKVCVNTREISSPGESIICAPNRIVITIEGKNDEVDAIVT